jgi:DNA excision repair protein ERCC-6
MLFVVSDRAGGLCQRFPRTFGRLAMDDDGLDALLIDVGAHAVDAGELESRIKSRILGATGSGIDSDASDAAVRVLIKQTRRKISATKRLGLSHSHALDRLRVKLQMLLELTNARSHAAAGADGDQDQEEAGPAGSHLSTVLDLGREVRMGLATPEEQARIVASQQAAQNRGKSTSPSARSPLSSRAMSSRGRRTPPSSRVAAASSGSKPLSRSRRSSQTPNKDDDYGDTDEGEDEGEDSTDALSEGGDVGSWRAQVSGTIVDDTLLDSYSHRVQEWLRLGAGGPDENIAGEGATPLWLPGAVARKLMGYQRTALRWLWSLHGQGVGGIVADEMGLGKTAQVVTFLAALRHSGMTGGSVPGPSSQAHLSSGEAATVTTDMTSKIASPGSRASSARRGPRFGSVEEVLRSAPKLPALVVCPATLLAHWFREAVTWYAPLRVMVLHDSGRYRAAEGASHAQAIRASRSGGFDLVLITYAGMRHLQHLLAAPGIRWGYVVLDEGHLIRNPDAEVTRAAKLLRCRHRLVLSGSPVQNSLRELWSVMDFACPGKLGDAVSFESTFAGPIAAGGWASATPAAQAMAYERAIVLRGLIRTYLLRRRKRDVAKQLPAKTEQVLFCDLTPLQLRCYMAYLASEDVESAISGRQMAFKAMSVLRTICNHPWLVAGGRLGFDASAEALGDSPHSSHTSASSRAAGASGLRQRGSAPVDATIQRLVNSEPGLFADSPRWQDSGKLRVMVAVMSKWHEQGHRCLIFCQGLRMLGVIQEVCGQRDWSYRRMDGSTPIRRRQGMVDEFNGDDGIFCFLMTTRTGGVGLNLTGANRVIIFDPDWNPSTDAQARERSWRLGQQRSVKIFRLITKGTLEEKVYQRQVFKTVLQKRVLTNPDQKAVFHGGDLRDLFTIDTSSMSMTSAPRLPATTSRRQPAARSSASGSEELWDVAEPAGSSPAAPDGAADDADLVYDADTDSDNPADPQAEASRDEAMLTELLGAASRAAGAGTDAEARAGGVVAAARGVDMAFRREARRAALEAAKALQAAPQTAPQTAPPPARTHGRGGRRGARGGASPAGAASSRPSRPASGMQRSSAKSPKRGASRKRAGYSKQDRGAKPGNPAVDAVLRNRDHILLQFPVEVHRPGAVALKNWGQPVARAIAHETVAARAAAARPRQRGKRAGSAAGSIFGGHVAGAAVVDDSVLSTAHPHSSALLANLRMLQASRAQGEADATAAARAALRNQMLGASQR